MSNILLKTIRTPTLPLQVASLECFLLKPLPGAVSLVQNGGAVWEHRAPAEGAGRSHVPWGCLGAAGTLVSRRESTEVSLALCGAQGMC